ncbi:hypothetical protein G4177_26460 [Corallococcus sp. ZKHCc1 1396]|uniref:Uncharacterized protein n=2 Tax=Corallococcus soli TaxID=2710757 RepID=A0ABR9PV47_9BACT|nr:hypothetical protein [Corallococcus soli]MBE4751719.1 hypothetical protein [Corallococcus soli]
MASPATDVTEAAAPSAASGEASPAPSTAKAKRAGKNAARPALEEPGEPEAPAPETAKPSRPAADPQYLVLTGGSPFLRAIGFVRRADGEPLPGFVNLSVSKMATLTLPTEPGHYEFRFQTRNGNGDFKLAQRTERGSPRNVRDFEMEPSGVVQTYRFSIP